MKTQQLLSMLYSKGIHLALEQGDLLAAGPADGIAPELIALIRERKADLVALLASLDAAAAAGPVPRAAARAPAYAAPASLAQQRMLFMEELAGGQSYYNIPVAFDIDGPLERGALADAFTLLATAHDILRTVYVQQGGEWLQEVGAPAPVALAFTDLCGDAGQEQRLAALLQEESQYCFDLQRERPLRARLFALAPQRHVLAINIHHIAADGWSARRVIDDLGQAYRAALSGTPATAASPWQYADYAAWQQAWQSSAQYQQARSYWGDTLQGMPQLHSVPTDFIRPQVQDIAGATYRQALGPALSASLEQFARAAHSTPFVVFQAAFAALLARYSGETDIVFGTAAANRQPVEFLDTVGLFVNTLVLRYAVGDVLSFAGLVRQAAAVSDGAFRHQQLPFDALVDLLQPARSAGYNPLVQLMLVMQDRAAGALALAGAQVCQRAQRQPVAKFDLALHIHPGAEGFGLHWEFNTSLFKEDSIAAMAAVFATLLAACLADPAQPVAGVPLEAAPEWAPPALAARCVHRLFEEQAARRPHAIAVRDGAQGVSYGELERRANGVAAHLQQAGAARNSHVGVCMEKSVELVVAMLAVYKLGAVYVPLDPHYPAERLANMVEDADLCLLLCHGAVPPSGLAAALPVLQAAALHEAPAGVLLAGHDDVASGAYVIYTSGSTGRPKGVLVTHANLYHSLRENGAVMGFGENDSMPTIGSQAFGVSLLEILLPLVHGGAVDIINKSQVLDLQQLTAATDGVTVLHAVPSLMRQWLEAVAEAPAGAYPNLRLLLVGGESVSDTLLRQLRQWRPELRLLALYGMTESTIVCSSYEPGQAQVAHYCIGKPYASACFQVLNRQGQLQPLGVPGELYIGGLTVAARYLNQPGLTAERFIASTSAQGARLYRTGDRVRRLADGHYEFLGRVDHQVSLRGARIEMGEIETLAAAVEGVRQAVAHVALLGGEEPILVLYYSAAEAASGELPARIRAELARHLPDYMRPSILHCLESFPLNPNGKVDRKRLPQPHAIAVQEALSGPTEERLARLWREVLQCDSVSATANFFELGGHSLMATKLATRVRADFGVSFPLSVLFSTPTVRACAAQIALAQAAQQAARLMTAPAGPEREELVL